MFPLSLRRIRVVRQVPATPKPLLVRNGLPAAQLIRAKIISIIESPSLPVLPSPSIFRSLMASTMAEMDFCDEPASKRRKVSKEANLQRPDILQRYIPIARASLAVEVVQGEAIEGLHSPTYQHPINLKAITHGEGGPHTVKLTTLNKKSLPDLQISGSSPADANALQVFEDANKLESLWKYSSNISSLPLTCARATITSTQEPTHRSKSSYALEVEILWYNTTIAQDKVTELAVELLNRYQGSNSAVFTDSVLEPWSPRDFYDNIHIPEKTSEASAKIKVDLLQCQLYPFQRRAVRWLLQKEGVRVEPSGHVSSLADGLDNEPIPDSFRRSVDADGQECFVSDVFGVVSDDLPGLQARYCGVRGGILAEEMGLGKTVEMIALMCLHRRQDDPKSVISGDRSPKVSGATLIITPVPILEQWRQEIMEHAPSLKVYQYTLQAVHAHPKTHGRAE